MSAVGQKRKRLEEASSSTSAGKGEGSKRSKKGAEAAAPVAASRPRKEKGKLSPVRGEPLLSVGDLEDDDVRIVVFRAPEDFDWSALDGKTIEASLVTGSSTSVVSGVRLHTADRSDAAQLRVLAPLDEDSDDDNEDSESSSSSDSDSDDDGGKRRKVRKQKRDKTGRVCRMVTKRVAAVVEVAPAALSASSSAGPLKAKPSGPVQSLLRPVQLARRAVVQQPSESMSYVYRPIGAQTEDPMFGGLGSGSTVKPTGSADGSASSSSAAAPATGKKEKKDKKEKKEKKEKK